MLVQGVVGGWNLSWNDVLMPPLVPVVGILILGALLYRGLQAPSRRTLVAAGIAGLALVAVPIAYLQSQRLGVGEVVQPRYVLPLLTLVVGVVSVGPRLGRPLPIPRVPGVLVAVALSISAFLGFWSYAHRFFAGTTVGLFDPKVDPAWTNGVGIPAWLVVLAHGRRERCPGVGDGVAQPGAGAESLSGRILDHSSVSLNRSAGSTTRLGSRVATASR